MLKVAGSIPGIGCTDLYCARGAQGVLPMRAGGSSQLDLQSLTPLSVAGYDYELAVTQWATSVVLQQVRS